MSAARSERWELLETKSRIASGKGRGGVKAEKEEIQLAGFIFFSVSVHGLLPPLKCFSARIRWDG